MAKEKTKEKTPKNKVKVFQSEVPVKKEEPENPFPEKGESKDTFSEEELKEAFPKEEKNADEPNVVWLDESEAEEQAPEEEKPQLPWDN